MQAGQALLTVIAFLTMTTAAGAEAALCPSNLERLVETRREGNKTIHVCVCKDGYVRSAESKKCVRAKNIETAVSGEVAVATWDGRKLDAGQIAQAASDPLSASAVFARGNVVKTGAAGRFSMTLPDGENVSIDPNSTLGFETVEFGSTGRIERMTWQLVDGLLRWEGKARKVLKDSIAVRYGVRAGRNDVVCGVRGTKFEMIVADDAGEGICWDVRCACHRPCEPSASGHVDLYEGALDIIDKSGAIILTMQPGERIVFDSGGAVIGPSSIPQP